MAQKEKKGYIEELIGRDAQKCFDKNCSVKSGKVIPLKWLEDNPKKEHILEMVDIEVSSTFCQGVFYGWEHPQKVDVENLPQEIKNLNYLFAFNFHDNDFGNYFEEGAKNFCDDLNKLFVSIGVSNRYECEYSTKSLKDEINDFISLDKLIDYIAKGICIYSLRNRNISLEDIYKECQDMIKSFSVKEKDKNYIFGSIKDVSEKIIKENAKIQMEPKPKELEDMWLNGEYLFVKIENGFAETWTQ